MNEKKLFRYVLKNSDSEINDILAQKNDSQNWLKITY